MDPEKKTAHVHCQPVYEGELDFPGTCNEEGRGFSDAQWRTGVVARFPWVGFGALFTVLVCAACAVVVLVISDNKSQKQWPDRIAPNVILSVLNNISNICFGAAIANGIAIAWWRKSLKGATIVDLHRSWSYSASLKDIVLSGKYFNLIALTALTAKLTMIDGILMQEATTTFIALDQGEKIHNAVSYAMLDIPSTARLESSATQVLPDKWFSRHIESWSQSGGLFSNSVQCDGYCLLTIPAAGFEFDCSTSNVSANVGKAAYDNYNTATMEASVANSSNINSSSAMNFTYSDTTLFYVSFDVDYRNGTTGYEDGINYSRILLNITTSATTSNETFTDANGAPSCPGILTTHTCSLRPAIVEYPITIRETKYVQGDFSYLDFMTLGYNSSDIGSGANTNSLTDYIAGQKQQDNFTVKEYRDVYETADDYPRNSQLAGIVSILQDRFTGSNSLVYSADDGFSGGDNGISQLWSDYAPTNHSSECAYQYEDPLSFLVQQINSIIFSVSKDAFGYQMSDNGWYPTPEQYGSYNATKYTERVYYHTQTGYMFGAVAAMFVCVLCVLPSYYGYWQLGRQVTLGPFEIANAFRAPILDHPQASNAVVKTLIKEVGDKEVKYGEMVTSEAAGRLAMAEPHAVRRVHPKVGSAKEEINEHVERMRHDVRKNLERMKDDIIGRKD